ncbi:MAG TPA: glycosyltransferase family 4 protein [Anaerolineales bacterium]
MVSFREKLVKGLTARGIGISYDLSDEPYDAILVIGGTRDLIGLWRAKRNGVRIIQRLDGMNWIHRKRHTGWRHYLRAEYGNILLSLIRSRLADQIVYQSKFSRKWWESVYGENNTPWQVVYNGVDLERYTPDGAGRPPEEYVRLLIVEGSIGGGYEWGLETAIQLAERMTTPHIRDVELMVVGRISTALQQEWKGKAKVRVSFMGQVLPEQIPELDRSAHMLFAADINPACPNAVIEAMACGLPILAFDTGALSELVTPVAGRLARYGRDPWKLDPPDVDGLAESANLILNNQAAFRKAARRRAEEAFGLDLMVDSYLEALNL